MTTRQYQWSPKVPLSEDKMVLLYTFGTATMVVLGIKAFSISPAIAVAVAVLYLYGWLRMYRAACESARIRKVHRSVVAANMSDDLGTPVQMAWLIAVATEMYDGRTEPPLVSRVFPDCNGGFVNITMTPDGLMNGSRIKVSQ